jgi:ferritin
MGTFHDLMNAQIANEFGASQQYIAIAVHYDQDALPQLAARFYEQAIEERNHAMMLVQYLLDRDVEATIPAVEAPQTRFGDVTEPIALALAQEKRVTDQITALAAAARAEGDYLGEQFMHWFLKEQVEEVSSMTTLLQVAQRCQGNLMQLEEFLARTAGSEGADPTAPAAAGGAL